MSELSTASPYERNEIWVDEQRIRSERELPRGINLVFHDRSQGNSVQFAARNRWKGVTVDLSCAIECAVSIGKIRVHFGGLRVSFVANNHRYSSGVSVSVGDGCVFDGSTHVIGPLTSGCSVRIGRECLFATHVSVRGSSHHGLWATTTGRLLNAETGVEIGDHVWIGDQAVVLNSARIASGSVVQARTVVNRAFRKPRVLLGGVPARVLKRRIEWTSDFPLDNGRRRRKPVDRDSAS